jgi:hypothetical protein
MSTALPIDSTVIDPEDVGEHHTTRGWTTRPRSSTPASDGSAVYVVTGTGKATSDRVADPELGAGRINARETVELVATVTSGNR